MARRFSGGAQVAVFLARAHAARNARHRCGGGPDAPRWLVAVHMVSEGVDVPRLILAVYATAKRTDLFFRQAVGRVVRCRAAEPDDLEATVFLPADEALKACAERVEVELRQEVRDQIDAAFDVEAPHAVGRRRDFEPLDAEVQAGGMIVAGVHYRRDEVEAARRLLRELGQPERALRSVLQFVRRERLGPGPAAHGAGAADRAGAADGAGHGHHNQARSPMPAAVPAHRRLDAKRRALDRLARRWAELRRAIDPSYTWPQAQARVNRAMGVARRNDAGERQLDAGLAFLRSELTKLAQAYPAEAERLRIPGSVEAIDGQLAAATVGNALADR